MEYSRRKILVIAAAVLLTAGLGFALGSRALAARPPGPWTPNVEHRLAFLRAALDLTDTQTEHIRAIIVARRDAARPLRLELNQQAQHLLERTQTEPASSPATRETIQRISQLSAQLVTLHLESALEIRQQLTPEQQQKAERFLRAMLEHQREWDRPVVEH